MDSKYTFEMFWEDLNNGFQIYYMYMNCKYLIYKMDKNCYYKKKYCNKGKLFSNH